MNQEKPENEELSDGQIFDWLRTAGTYNYGLCHPRIDFLEKIFQESIKKPDSVRELEILLFLYDNQSIKKLEQEPDLIQRLKKEVTKPTSVYITFGITRLNQYFKNQEINIQAIHKL